MSSMLSFETTALAVGALYAGYFVTSVAALSCLLAEDTARWPVDFAMVTLFVTSGLHFAFTAAGFAVVEDYDPDPVEPKWAFRFADYVQAGAVGAAIASYALDPTHRVAAYVGTSVTMATQLLCFYKTYALIDQARSGRRDRLTGVPI
jgi:hypothetical protein